ncbi:UNVERIFIED_CONTAM: hypothetical protein PYX00_007742 [Menopon gallinae]|uniref:Mitochondrial import inner membrane translocase subunit Tim16 n=1 Tax=Menopon gallinae TaxID=328185 RepID=A0AAW2HKD8_9NEOP
MAKYLLQILYQGSRLVGRAFLKALREEINASEEAAKRAGGGRRGAASAAENTRAGLTVEEAQKILNVNNLEDVEQIKKNFEHLFQVNDRSRGGSFYLQSKVVRAKERLDREIETMSKTKKEEIKNG